MKIFVIPSTYRSPLNIQSNIFVHEQCMSLYKKGHDVIVLDTTERSYKKWNHPLCKKPSFRFEESIKVYSWWTRAVATTRFPSIFVKSVSKRLDRLWKIAVEKEGMPDVIYAHFTFPSGYSALQLSRKYNVPLVVLEHGGMYLNKSIHPKIQKYLTSTHMSADVFMCVSSAHEKAIKKWTGIKRDILVVPNMISDAFMYAPRVDKESFVFFSAGNLKQVKRFDLLIESFSDAFKNNSDVFLRIAGDGTLREYLQELIDNSPCKDRIILLGRLDREKIREEYEMCDAFALVSDHESFGVAYREAMACGRPVISTDNGGISDGWDDSFGEIVPLSDKNALTQAFVRMYKNYSRFSHKNISDMTLRFCSEKSVMQKVEDILRSVIKP